MARLGGAPDYPFVVIPHPVGSLNDEELKTRAEMVLPQVLSLLLTKG
ncbi:MAG: hypothetical protein HYU29_07105 [Chloroflexi bacterium]|nr:hypothetical protein [Chloroflexota bacterium]